MSFIPIAKFTIQLALGLALAQSALYPAPAEAADAKATKSIYEKDRADCEAGRGQQDRATCLKEAAAAAQERTRSGLANEGSARQNTIERCKPLPPQDKADCLARVDGSASSNQEVTTSGSVAAGGILRETRTKTTGRPASARPASEPGASAPQ
jgi:hypothetical protein